MKRGRLIDLAIGLFLLLLPMLWFAPQALGNRTLLPTDNLFTSAPWSSFAAEQGATTPYNPLISDLVLENYPWKSFLREALRSGQLPLWNSRLFAGVPFLASGQHSALYPLSIIFYVVPLWRAYGIFTWLQLGLAALGLYVFARVLGLRRPPATLGAVAYAFSGFFIVSVNFTMIIAAAVWLPYILAVIELMARATESSPAARSANPVPTAGAPASAEPALLEGQPSSSSAGLAPAHTHFDPASSLPLLAVLGAILLGVQILAGHIEITYYVLLVSSLYAIWRLIGAWRGLRANAVERPWQPLLRLMAWLAVMVVLGFGLGTIQLIPLYELVRESFREGSASLSQVRGWAWPVRQIITFVLPDAFGNPTHHSYFDIWQRVWVPVTTNALGRPISNIDWGAKNYVEGGNYLGIITLLLALLAVLASAGTWLSARFTSRQVAGDGTRAARPFSRHPRTRVAFFAILAVLSLLFAFGTPLYAVLYYLLPGYKQLHSAFRWVFPYTLCMSVLAAYGLNYLLVARDQDAYPPLRRAVWGAARILGIVGLTFGLGALALVAASMVVPGPFVTVGQRILDSSDLARSRGFANPAMAWSYEAVGVARFGLMAALAGAVLLWASRRGRRSGSGQGDAPRRASGDDFLTPLLWSGAAILLLIGDLWLFGHAFNPAADPKLLDFKPPVVAWLQSQMNPSQPWRLTAYETPGEKIFNPNVGMPYGLEDVRGYDSIIPRQYVAYMERHQPQTDLLYNRIAPTYSKVNGQPAQKSLDDPLLNLLGVRYVLSTQAINNPAYHLAYDGEIKVYENTRALPRAFYVPAAVAASNQAAALDALRSIDPKQTVVIEGADPGHLPAPGSASLSEMRISRSTDKEVFVDVNVNDHGWLLLTENFFPGWKAYLRPFGSQGEGLNGSGEAVEQQISLYRADGTFRAVYLDRPGQWTVRFVYSPRSFLLGGYLSFLAFITLALIAAAWAWRRWYRGEHNEVVTVAKNSAVQMGMSLLNKGIDFAFAMLRLRILSPAGEGSYTFAINFYIVLEIVTRYGLGTLLARDVAQDRDRAGHYMTNVVLLRIGLWLATLPVLAVVLAYYHVRGRLSPEEAQAIIIFAGALFFANIADALSSVFIAFEKMEYPASLATATTVGKVALGGLVLLPPFNMGFVGLTWVSLIMNAVQVVWLFFLLKRHILPHRAAWTGVDFHLQRKMLSESGPLMINNLLASAFWRVGVWILYDAAGAAAVGIFSAGVKYLDGLNVIPAYFTLAIFPLMSRHAHSNNEGVNRAYRLALQFLFIISLPIAVFVTFAATPMIRILGGSAYLPDSATALSIMIWSIPFGFMNSVTQYALIAVGQQRYLTRAFMIGVTFTVIAGVVFIPRYGYLAAAAIMIPSELSLFIPFYWAVQRHVGATSMLGLCGVPVLAAIADAGIVALMSRGGLPLWLSLPTGALAYLLVLGALGTFRSPDFAVLWSRFGDNRILRSLRLVRTE